MEMSTHSRQNVTNYFSSRQMSRALTEEFLRAYHSHTCLWKIRSPEYMNKELKNEAYNHLEVICHKERPEAEREFVVKKINSLRGSFRREYRRVVTGNGNYVPQLWFYDLLSFTADQDNDEFGGVNVDYGSGGDVASSTNNSFGHDDDGYSSYYVEEDEMKKYYAVDENNLEHETVDVTQTPIYDLSSPQPESTSDQDNPIISVQQETTQMENDFVDEENISKDDHVYNVAEIIGISTSTGGDLNSSSIACPAEFINMRKYSVSPRPSKRKKTTNHNLQSKSQTPSAAQQNSGFVPSGFDGPSKFFYDEHDAFGVTVAAKLRKMDLHQRLFAENIINQTLFKGMLKCLKPPKELILDFDDTSMIKSQSESTRVKEEILDDVNEKN